MAISFGGLASGMDTSSLISSLMTLERAPLTRMEADKTWLNNRLTAFQEFDKKLSTFLTSVKTLNDRDQYYKQTATTSSKDYLTATASTDALSGTSYQVEVESLAQVQKSYSNATDGLGHDTLGFSSKTSKILGTGNVAITVTVDGTPEAHTIALTAENNSLEGLMQAINDADIGVTASIINDGTANPYRLALTGAAVGTSFTFNGSALVGGSETFSAFTTSQTATQAHIIVDGLDIYSNSNTVSDAIPGVTLNLLQAESGKTTQIRLNEDTSAVTKNINAFIAGYNEAIAFVTSQSTMGDSEGGVLGGDSGLNSVKRHLQDMLTTQITNQGEFKALSQLGLETQKDGTLKLNSTVLNEAIDTNLDSVVSLLAGNEDGTGGLASQLEEYLTSMTDSTKGLLAGRRENINSNIERIDDRIAQMELRLAKREETLKSQFTAMEQLVSVMNSQSDYLTQQMSALSNLWNYNK
jgi:flagellar hook-associated protein 2